MSLPRHVVQFGEDLDRQAGVADVLAQLLDGGETEVGDLLLADVEEGRRVAEPALDERQQPALVAGNEVLPRARIALADLLHQQAVAFGRHRDPSSWRSRYQVNHTPTAINARHRARPMRSGVV